MQDAWDGRPSNPQRDGWHWLQHHNNPAMPFHWLAPDWRFPSDDYSAEVVASWGYRYLGPALLPADLAARDAATREKALREAAELVSMHVYSIGPEGAYLRPHKDAAIDLHHRTIAAAILALIPQQQEDRTDA